MTPTFAPPSVPYVPPADASLTTSNEDAAQNGNQKMAAAPNV